MIQLSAFKSAHETGNRPTRSPLTNWRRLCQASQPITGPRLRVGAHSFRLLLLVVVGDETRELGVCATFAGLFSRRQLAPYLANSQSVFSKALVLVASQAIRCDIEWLR